MSANESNNFSRDEYLAARRRLHALRRLERCDNDEHKHETQPITKRLEQTSKQPKECGDEGTNVESALEVANRQQATSREAVRLEACVEEAEAALERAIRTAGLRKGRENEILDELAALRMLRRNLSVACAASSSATLDATVARAIAEAHRRQNTVTAEAVVSATTTARSTAQAESEHRIQVK
jgi:hypothetical protein